MSRCLACGWQCCRKCLAARGGDRTHQSFTSVHTPENKRRGSTRQGDGEAGNHSRPSTSTQEAAETLVGISGSMTPSRRGGSVMVSPAGPGTGRGIGAVTVAVAGRRGSMEKNPREDLAEETDDDETLTDLSVSEHESETWEEGPIRRNPPRASRPSALSE